MHVADFDRPLHVLPYTSALDVLTYAVVIKGRRIGFAFR